MHPAGHRNDIVTWTGVAIVSTVCIAMSGLWLTQLATDIGIPPVFAWSLPVTVDAGGAVASVLWISHTGQVRTWSRAIAIGSLMVSFAGNVMSHLIELHILHITWQLVVAVSGVYPLMCWLMIHLVGLSREEPANGKPLTKVRPATKAQHAAPKPALKPEPAADVPQPQRMPLHAVGVVSKKQQGRDHFHRLVREGRDPATITAAEIDTLIGSVGYSKKHIAPWREEA